MLRANDTCTSTLLDILRARAKRTPERPAYTFHNRDWVEETLSYAALDERARAIAVRLREVACAGDRVLLLYPSGLSYISAFFGCLYAGVFAVPAYPPRAGKSRRGQDRLCSILKDSEPAVVLTSAELLARTEHFLSGRDTMCVAIESIDTAIATRWTEPDIDAGSIAFLQYTSGSTTQPRGVMVTHRNILANERLIQNACGHTEDSTFVGWLPLYHDMGIIGNVLQPLYVGSRCVLMSPTSFLEQPVRWLRAISRFGARTSGGPNFAYDLCAQRISEKEKNGLDLSSWAVAFNGAEPVRAETMNAFAKAFAPCGFRREAFLPCYGLAESTLMVAAARPGAGARSKHFDARGIECGQAVPPSANSVARPFVSCGHSVSDTTVKVVDPATARPLEDGRIGEIWVSGPSVASGYWNRKDESDATFRAKLNDGAGAAEYLRTGDLGFFHENTLFVAGRLRDLIIVRGQNYFSEDLEWTVRRIDLPVALGSIAACPIDIDGEERAHVFVEIDHLAQPNHNEIFSAIRGAIANEHDIQVHSVILVKIGLLPKTTSGKIQRQECRKAYLEGTLEILDRSELAAVAEENRLVPPSRSESAAASSGKRRAMLAAYVRVVCVQTLRLERLGYFDPLIDAGLDSLGATEIRSRLAADFEITLPFSLLLQGGSVSDLVDELEVRLTIDSGRAGASAPSPAAAQACALSHGQRGLWFMHQVAPESDAFTVSCAGRVRSGLNETALWQAARAVVRRHAALRTVFQDGPEGPQQKTTQSDAALELHDVTGMTDDELRAAYTRAAAEPFDLGNGPLFRIHLFRRGPDNHAVLLCAHHLVSDLWSVGVIMKDLARFYGAAAANASIRVVPAPPYSDFVRWQQGVESGHEQLWKYWSEQLSGELPATTWPVPAASTVQTCGAGVMHRSFGPRLSSRVREFCRKRKITPYVLLLACYKVALHHYTGQRDLIVGTPASGRDCAEFMEMVGYLVNLVVVRTRVPAYGSFSDYLELVNRQVLDALEHQGFPFPLLVERLQPMRDGSPSPIVRTIFAFHKMASEHDPALAAFAAGVPGACVNLGGLELEALPLQRRNAQFDLSLLVADTAEGFVAALEYETAVLDDVTVGRLADHFENLLCAVITEPDMQIGLLPRLTPEERRLVVSTWNETAIVVDGKTSIVEAIERQADRTPHAVAVVSGEQQLSYACLNRRSGQLARYLCAEGVGPESLVGLYMDRSADMVVALLGVLKAGGAYVPLDPSYPRDRIRFMLEDARLKWVLTRQRLAADLQDCGAQVICMDSDWPRIAAEHRNAVRSPIHPLNMAYAIYTSGSTGKPKGVINTHAGILNRLLWVQDAYGLRPDDCVLQKTPCSFDVSVWEFLWPLFTGAKLAMAKPDGHRDPQYLAEYIREQNVTTLHFVPPMLQVFLDQSDPRSCRSLRRVICSGEALGAPLRDLFFERMNAELHNLYGPTEAAIDVTSWNCEADDKRGAVPIGRPIWNTQIYVLQDLMPVPIGVHGEIYIGGIGVSRGYIERPDLTAERYVPDPFSTVPGQRMYRTGDIGFFSRQGAVHFVGRADRQIKLRGFRVELEEVEASLRADPRVMDAVAAIAQDGHGEPYLAAYVILAPDQPPDLEPIRRELRTRLPYYMIPSVLVRLDHFVLTPNGKLDRSALPKPQVLQPARRAPETELERIIAERWADVLDLPSVSAEDNFFEMGGHSLLATRLAWQLQDVFPTSEPLLGLLYRNPTVSDLATAMKLASPPDIDLDEVAGLYRRVQNMSDSEVLDRL